MEIEILSAISEEIELARKHVERNANMRNRFPNRQFIKEQKAQKERYENIVKWNIPEKILSYIKAKFNLQKITDVHAICRYVNETTISVRFSYGIGAGVEVIYNYTETPSQPSIIHKTLK